MKPKLKWKRAYWWYALLLLLVILTVLCVFDIKFVIGNLNIIMIDGAVIAIGLIVLLWRWVNHDATWLKIVIATVGTVAIPLAAFFFLVGGSFENGLPEYVEATEPQTGRTFVAECRSNFLQKGSVKLYERFGPFIIACDTEMYSGEITEGKDPKAYLSEDGESIVVELFWSSPIFTIPLD